MWMLAQTTWPLPYIQDEGCLSLGPSQGFKDAIHLTRDTPMMLLLRRQHQCFSDLRITDRLC